LLGIRHATDADHIVVIATIVKPPAQFAGLGRDRRSVGDRADRDDPDCRRRDHFVWRRYPAAWPSGYGSQEPGFCAGLIQINGPSVGGGTL
jgi:hypothetical protein